LHLGYYDFATEGDDLEIDAELEYLPKSRWMS